MGNVYSISEVAFCLIVMVESRNDWYLCHNMNVSFTAFQMREVLASFMVVC